MLFGRLFWDHETKKEIDRLAIWGIVIHGAIELKEGAGRPTDVGAPRVGQRDALAEPGAPEAFASEESTRNGVGGHGRLRGTQ